MVRKIQIDLKENRLVDPRFDKISELFINYSNGNFDYQVEPSDKLDEIDAFISSINMLGEELKEITISKQFFNNVFDSVSDLIFVLDLNGNIQKTNNKVTSILKIKDEDLLNINIDVLLHDNSEKSFFNNALKRVKNNSSTDFQSTFYLAKKNSPILCSLNGFYDELGVQRGYILFVKDLSSLKKVEKSLKASEEKYKKLFEESGDAIAVINSRGSILELNEAARFLFGIETMNIKKQNILNFIQSNENVKDIFKTINQNSKNKEITLKIVNNINNNIYTCLLSISHLSNSNNLLVLIKDITDQIEMENLVIRTIVETQENERKRFARDIHDSLGQELSAVKFYLSALNENVNLDDKNKSILLKTEEGLSNILASIREICFNLMPKTLEKFGLIMAVKELCNSLNKNSDFICKINSVENFPRLSSEKEVGVFRIIQEFINNSVKHSKGDQIKINFTFDNSYISVRMQDNGIGFDLQNSENFNGMGLKNMNSRARSYNGNLKITSNSKGTSFNLKIPIN